MEDTSRSSPTDLHILYEQAYLLREQEHTRDYLENIAHNCQCLSEIGA